MTNAIRVCLAMIVLGLAAGASEAIPRSASIVPEIPTVTDIVILQTEMLWSSSGFFVTGQSFIFSSPTSIEVDILVSAPGLGEIGIPVFNGDTVETSLGILAAGVYTFTITERLTFREIDPGFDPPNRQLVGQFFVVPEPGSALLLGFGLLLLGCGNRRQSAAASD